MLRQFVYLLIFITHLSNPLSAWALSPNTTLENLPLLTPSQAEEKHLALTFKYLRQEMEDKLKQIIPKDFFYGKIETPSKEDLLYPNGKNIYAIAHLNAAIPLLLASQELAGTNFFLIPSTIENIFIQEGRVYCSYAIFINKEGKLSYGKFETPLELHSSYHSDPESKDLEAIGFPLLTHSSTPELTEDKLKIKKLLGENGVPIPRGITVSKKDISGSDKKIKKIIQKALLKWKREAFVIKPVDRSQGLGVRIFETFQDPKHHLEKLFISSEKALIEERIESFIVIDDSRMPQDLNVRSLVSFDEQGQPIVTALNIRMDSKTKNPVNGAQGAHSYSFEYFFKVFGLEKTFLEQVLGTLSSFFLEKFGTFIEFIEDRVKINISLLGRVHTYLSENLPIKSQQKSFTPNQILKLKRRIVALSKKTAQLIQNELKKEDPTISGGILGLDIMIDKKLNLYVLEANSGPVGGLIESVEITNGNLAAVKPIIKKLQYLSKQTTPTSKENIPKKNFLTESAIAWQVLGGLYREDKLFAEAEFALKKALEIDPNDVSTLIWLGLVLMEQKKDALAPFKKAVELDPINHNGVAVLADFYILTDKEDAAITLLKNTQRALPDNKEILLRLGEAHFKKENWKEATQAFNRLIEMGYYLAESNYFLALIYLEKEPPNQVIARMRLHRTLQLHPNHIGAKKTLHFMNTGHDEEQKILYDALKSIPSKNGQLDLNTFLDRHATTELLPIHTFPDRYVLTNGISETPTLLRSILFAGLIEEAYPASWISENFIFDWKSLSFIRRTGKAQPPVNQEVGSSL